MKRDYLSLQEATKMIASEVIETGSSKDWGKVDTNSIDLAKSIEKHLARYNIGYTDPKAGTWSFSQRGTRYFSYVGLSTLAKSKFSSLVSAVSNK